LRRQSGRIEDAGLNVGGDTGTGVADGDHCVVAFYECAQPNRAAAAGRCHDVPGVGGVDDQIQEDLVQIPP
jgi:hypothetical protein